MSKKIRLNQVALQRDLKVTKPVGNVTIPAGSNYATISATKDGRQKSVQEVLEEMFSGDKMPTVVQPTVSLDAKCAVFEGDENVRAMAAFPNVVYAEVGSEVRATGIVGFAPGSYEFGPTPTGCAMTESSIKMVSNKTGDIDPVDDVMTCESILYGEELKVQAEVSYSEGLTPSTQLGEPAASLKIAAGTATKASQKIVAIEAAFFGPSPYTYEEMASDGNDNVREVVRALNHVVRPLVDGEVFEITSEANTKSFMLAVPNNIGDKSYSISAVLPDSLNAVVNDFNNYNHISSIGSANKETELYHDYTLFWWTPESLQEGTRVQITLKIK